MAPGLFCCRAEVSLALDGAASHHVVSAMAEKFDAYYKWLGIPPKDQPPSHYRLLGLEVFESDPEVIDRAANRLMDYLHSITDGEHLAQSQTLLNQIATARLCLLDEAEKARYDEH